MAGQKKRLVKGDNKEVEKEKRTQRFIKLVEIVRNSKNIKKIDEAFNEIVELMKVKISHLSYSIKIPGLKIEDLYQEALFALRYKAIKDYDQTRSNRAKISPFDSFAVLCIRRHLSTKLKASYQGKQRVLNNSISLDQDRSNGNSIEEYSTLAEIMPYTAQDAFIEIRNQEDFSYLVKRLWEKMSDLEQKVFILYRQNMSYEEITKIINKNIKIKKEKINIKSVDNALSRIKSKGKEIYLQYEKTD